MNAGLVFNMLKSAEICINQTVASNNLHPKILHFSQATQIHQQNHHQTKNEAIKSR